MNKRPKTSSMWSYFTIVDKKDKKAKCDMCGLLMSFRSTVSNLKNHVLKKHPTVNLSAPTTSREHLSAEITQSNGDPSQSDDVEAVTVLCGPSSQNIGDDNCRPTGSNISQFVSRATTSSEFPVRPTTKESVTIRQTTIGNFVPIKIGAGQKRKIDKAVLRLFTSDFQPFSVVEDGGFRYLVNQLNPSYSLPDRKTISKSFIPAAFEECKSAVMEKLKTVASVCLTFDCWSSAAQESYLALTAHFVTDDFNFESVLLDCCLLEGSHTGHALACKVRDITDSFELSNKVSMVVTDNGSNMKSAVNELNWNHFGCYAHTLNLIVQDSLELECISTFIEKAKNIVKHFKRSNQDLEKLLKYQMDKGEKEPKKLILDVATRWNSTYYMMQRLSSLQEAVRATLALVNKEVPTITVEEWQICGDMCKALKPFEEVTRKLSGEKYISGSQIICLTSGLTDVCQKLLKKPLHATVLQVLLKLQEGILSRFNNIESNKPIGVCSFLDPRFKLYAFTSTYNQSLIKEHVKKLATAEFNAERDIFQREVTACPQTQSYEQGEDDEDLSVTAFLDEVLRKAQPPGTALSSAIIEVQRYLEERVLDRQQDPLKWWSLKQHAYPILAKLVKKHCNVVATSVPCERIFSKTGLIINDRRTRLKPSKVRELIFLNANDKFWARS